MQQSRQWFNNLPIYYMQKMEKIVFMSVARQKKTFSEPVPLRFQGKSILHDLYPLDDTTLDPRCYRKIKRS
jgi:hypothetical protein